MQLSLVGYEDAGASEERGYSQENMQSFGFSTRHGQRVEAGRPITVTTSQKLDWIEEVLSAQPAAPAVVDLGGRDLYHFRSRVNYDPWIDAVAG